LPVEVAIDLAESEYRRCGLSAELVFAGGTASFPVYTCTVRDSTGKVVSTAAGKGMGEQSRASALFEGWEHLSLDRGLAWLSRDPEVTRTLPIDEVLSQQVLRGDTMLHRLAAEYPTANVGCLRFENLSDPRAGLWYPAFLKSPFCMFHRIPGDDLEYKSFLRYASSNGSASGAGHDEALLHALLETVERDALSLAYLDWFVNATPGSVRVVEPDSLPDDLRILWRAVAGEIGSDPLLVDITTDLGIPVFCALPSLPDPVRIGVHGSGASLSPAYAVERALSELLQLAAVRPAHDVERYRRLASLDRWPVLRRCAELHPADLLALEPTRETFTISEERRDTAAEQVCEVTGRLADQGYETFHLQWNSDGSRIPVVAACVPGLETFSVHLDNQVPVLPTGRGAKRLVAADH
jgi:ribosomal protein S12 methylthiotransferase accessory factor